MAVLNLISVEKNIKTVRFYEVGDIGGKESEAKAKFDHRAAVLACCFSDATHAFSGGLDTFVREYASPFLIVRFT